MVICVLLPRFALAVAAGGRRTLLRAPAALAPEPGREQTIGEASLAAEAFGVRDGMRLGEALARCPQLALVPPDPMGVADAWERVLARLEAIGAEVESDRAGLACFQAAGLRRLHGGTLDATLAATRRALGGTVGGPASGADRTVGGPAAGADLAGGGPASGADLAGATALPLAPAARLGAGPSRFAALAAAHRARPRRAEVVADDAAAALRGEPVDLLRLRPATAALPEPLERLGVATLGAVVALGRAALADRFGPAGEAAHLLAQGRDEAPLRPRVVGELLEETLELPEAGSGTQLERALHLLVDRVLARRERRGRTLRAIVLSAKLVEGGTWRERVVFREALADPGRMRLALGRRLALLPAPAEALRLTVERFGPPGGDQRPLLQDSDAHRASRLREAVHQARAAAGPEAALRILEVDPDSRVPERRVVLTPYE